MYKLLILSLLGVINFSVGQILQDGQCNPNIPLFQNFDINNFTGIWHEIRSTGTAEAGECSTIELTDSEAAITVIVNAVRDNFYQEYHGQASVEANTARLSINVPSLSSNPIAFWVLNTDYNNFALTYGCENVGTTQRQVYIWQLSREKSFPNALIPAAMNLTTYELLGITNSDLREVSQSEDTCFLLPVIVPGQAVILPGQCNVNITGVADFQPARFLGVWHQIQSYYSNNAGGSCNRAQYSDGGDRVNVVNSQINNQQLFTIEGFATVTSNDSSGQLGVVLEVSPGNFAESDLLVLGTDYTQWAVTYTCNNLGDNTRQIFSWVVSRTRTLPSSAQAQVNQVINSLVELNNQYYITTDQSDAGCFHFPKTVGDEPAVFGGQCDMSIPVVSNFVAEDYMGLWHDIERYPTPFQSGACNNAFYTLGDNGVDVFNTQVLNEQLLTINGLAKPVADGKLVVSFPVANTNLTTDTDYWVLSTDYSNYSLVYSCRNINDYQQQVTFWKLSRTKQLSAQAQTQINAVMSTLDILNQDYFQSTNQSVEACFYYPEPQPEVPVQFPGSCETNIPVVPNFNIDLFQGEWFEVEAYPKDPQEGQCVSHRFSTGTGSAALNFDSSSVENQLLGSTNGQLNFYAGETGGRFTLSFVSNGTTISFPYYVIATDYTDYALVYSCLDIPDKDFRGIWAWKLSRSKQLSDNGIIQITNVLANSISVVLSNDYFEPIDQSDNACFYFPDLAPGEPVILPGQCDTDLSVVQNFNITRYLGLWRLIESYPATHQVGQCNQASYSEGSDGSILVYNNEVANQVLREINGFATFSGSETEGKLNVTFPNSAESYQLWVLDTDYDSYSIVYGCSNLNNQQRRVQSWKLSRSTSLTPAAIAAIDAVTNNITVLNNRYYQNVNQSDEACFYFPTPGTGPVIFRGQCDQNIPVVTGFNADAYMGLWHDIERYPTPFQSGSCNNAFYTLGDNGVDVFNTQVLDEQLLTINGLAKPVADGKLVVSFPIQNSTLTTDTDYWVLSTDYLSYSLVYSCRNINEIEQQVTFWKLSRTKQLSAQAQTQINAIMSTLDILNQDYFQSTNQSVEACFYYPEPQPEVPVQFPGSCETNIPVVPNFNIDLFQGEWFEVEAYPKDPQEGQCVSHRFSTGTGSAALNFDSSSVENQLLGSTNGQLNFYAGETGGRFTLSFVSNGTTISFPYYVIATDYTDYALVYSCLDIPDKDFRGIWAWKLSRSKQLSDNGIIQITNVLANSISVVLSNDYFEPIDQSDNACFYFPDLAPGEPVILPGQCDTDLSVVQNFNITRYLGLWRLIESYPATHQVGQCNQASYSEGSDGSILVYNNEVANQVLREINGFATFSGSETEGKLNVTFPNSAESYQLWVLDTDYDSYSIVYGCSNLNNQQRRVQSWKLSRSTSLTPAAIAAIDAVTNNITVLNNRYYQNVNQSDEACFYFPTPGTGPVIFRGQCDLNIPVVTGFNADAYMGLWHDIERYPTPFQSGSCNNAFYTLGDNGVDVFNTQVLDEQLLTINGLAKPVADGKLVVSFPIQNSTLTTDTDYWVLSTDYLSYSLVYSCRNINEIEQQVTFWKLSRTKQLSAQAQTQINAVMSTLDILNQDYFQSTNQSVEACFYYPEPQPEVPVQFPGSCETNIPVVPNFNIDLFQGEWFEVEAYPKDPQEGQCVSHRFSTGTGSAALNFDSSSVENQLLGSTNGQLNFYAGETGGRFTLSFVSNGTTISFPYYVIATDYTDYALVYSCLDIPDKDFRGIWAWKLSRSKQLSDNGIIQITNVLANSISVVLSNDYFEPIDQSDNACFYFPDLAPGEPVILPGQCDTDLSVVQNFNITRYLGLWRLIESYPATHQVGQCNQASYSEGSDGSILVYNNEVANQVLREINGFATFSGSETEGKLNVTFPNSAESYQLWVLDTDYDSYSIVYGCSNLNNQQRRVQSWKLSRSTSLTPAAIAAIDAVTNNITVLNNRYYQNVNQSDEACFYFPTPGTGPVIFRGQCDLNIPVVTGFNADAYMGLWHDIERYPTPFQSGSCNNAFYTLGDNGVDVFNTQVLDEQLLTINGLAKPVADGKLVVSFPIQNSTLTTDTDYWVLSTDYLSYSLVYSCRNINEIEQQVTFWKLSRTKQLSAQAQTQINAVMSTLDILNQDYFQSTNQSVEACFYYPEPQPEVPVQFPGSCETNIPVVPNFNIDLFQGEWFEVEAYPKDPQEGQCVSHRFSTGTGSAALNFDSSSVENQLLGSTNGQLNFYAGETGGRFTLSFVSNGTTISFPYYVIATDYINYALVYSCLDIPDKDMRGIWSWKLSRTKQLRPADDVAISNAIANVQVLDNQYYEIVNQTDEACFFYPDYVPGKPVVFPGQCANITAMPNFNATAYLGTWRTIESYPSEFQLGTCGEADYSLVDGIVVVKNTEVINETLSTIYGTAEPATDGTGKLYVTFPNAPFTVEYLVLATDYETYSLVYACVNSISSDERTVFSWKLGRSNTLPENLAINNTINSIDVLDERYYEVIDRNPSDCFYFPEPNNSTVVFRGQCNENVSVQADFNAVAYTGVWYSIESYPAPFQGGTCGKATYELDEVTGLVLVENTQVLNQVLDVQTGTAEVIDNAKLAVTFEVNGRNITSNYWILATDYISYSLVYSCQNINSEFKQVNSWKLSRHRTLQPDAESSINTAISNVYVLDQQYFVPEGQSEDDCFFYPENDGGDVILDGRCPSAGEVPAVTNFNVNLFSGTWHEVARFPIPDLIEGECAATNFATGDGVQNSLSITQTVVEDEFQSSYIVSASVSTDGRGVIDTTTVAGVPFNTLYILDTDYQEYALVYGCTELENNTKQIYSWKLARSRAGLSPDANSVVNQVVYNNIDLFEGYYYYTEQTNDACFHYPDAQELPDEIELPGPCDETIKGVENFNATAYIGLWLEIERYPETNQFGTCDRAFYSPGDGNVIVRNTQVVGDSLLEQLGSATASSDGTGQLTVTFNVTGVTVLANYYILDTDYENYALVYSCRNVDENRVVSSWKLSRTASLSSQAQAAMNGTIQETQGLKQAYYQTTSQSDEDCFYIPEFNPNSAPLFRGRCEAVSGVNDLDANRFAGWWHELESYPVDSNIGNCISSRYSPAGGGLQVVDSSVTSGTAAIVTGTVTVSNDGKLTRVLSNGVTEEIVVLATDHDNYALLFSCVDVTFNGEDYRRVWSAKHSKTRQLASVNVTAINDAIARNSVLYDRFYQQVDQSDAACFYYPEAGNQVILPGQCDLDIPVVENFDVSRYGGTWYQIERYPQIHESGNSTCVGARYLLDSDSGLVNVLNWEVINGELETIEGTANLTSTDGSARLEVTLPIRGTNDTVKTPLYVLATDYVNYALAYSCNPINSFERSIGAWKLSRDKTLTNASSEAIDLLVSREDRLELNANYFITVNHPEGCIEPSSSGNLVKSSIIVMLLCVVIQLLY